LASDLIFSAAFHGQKYARFIEFTPGFSSGWLCAYDGTCYNNEFVASFTSTAPVTQARDASYSPAYVAHIDSPITKTPNSEWTYAQVPCAPSEVDYLLEHLRPLVQDLKERDLVQRWFFLRYNSPNNHLRIRFQSAGATQQRVVRDIVCVALDEAVSELGLSGFSLQTYRPETERYGGLESLRLCERLFEHNSELFLSSLESIGASHNARFSIAMERAIELIASLLTRGHYKQWLLGNAHYEAKLSPEDRRILKLLQPKALGGALAVDGFLSEMGAALQRLESTGQLSRSLIDIVSAVLHMHCNRFGLGGGERRVRLIANALFRGVMTRG
jgi:thiopeptide-type bacteriocin biosynthesis protein